MAPSPLPAVPVLLRQFSAHHFRNYAELRFEPAPGLNVIIGQNGSGKTSLLEAIYLLGSGRSFRTGRPGHAVQRDSSELTVSAAIIDDAGHPRRLGLSRGRKGIVDVRLDGNRPGSLADMARVFPTQVFHPGTIQLVDGGASVRRRYLDWLVFHVEHEFAGAWAGLRKAVEQRNRLLKSRSLSLPELRAWEQQVARNSVRIHAFRQRHLPALQAALRNILSRFEGPAATVSMRLVAGWNEEVDPALLLEQTREQDIRRGFTGIGAHRADLTLESDEGLVRETLSRGQQKIVAYAMLLAQLALFNELTGKTCLVMIDDLSSELDRVNAATLLDVVLERNNQVLVTALDEHVLEHIPRGVSGEVFHVEHGNLRPASTFDKGRSE